MAKVNWSGGFARIARVTAWAFWIVAAVAIAMAWQDQVHTYANFAAGDYSRSWQWELAPAATKSAGTELFWCAIFYVVALYTFRALRWIAKGFAGA
jgi:hypothetical protein